jgi:hypothetical protein
MCWHRPRAKGCPHPRGFGEVVVTVGGVRAAVVVAVATHTPAAGWLQRRVSVAPNNISEAARSTQNNISEAAMQMEMAMAPAMAMAMAVGAALAVAVAVAVAVALAVA